MAEFNIDKMARSVAEKAMEELKDSGVFDEDTISRKHLLSEIDKLMKSPWFNNGKDDTAIPHYGYVERKEAVEIVRDLCVKAEPSVTPKPTECEDAVSKAIKTITNYCSERACVNCRLFSSEGCIFKCGYPHEWLEVGKGESE